jgi:Kef-type K+ transport system membrane component KefB
MPHLEISPVALLLAQIAIILVVSRILGLVTRWFGQPLVIAEVLAGVVLGPSLLGWLWPEALSTLFPPASLPVLKMVSELGLVLFMFLIGLELDPRLLEGRARSSLAIGYSSVIAPVALGAAAAWWLRDAYAPPGVPLVAFVLFLGAAMSITAFPVLARILSEHHLLTSRMGAISIASAAVADVTAWCLLAFAAAAARAQALSDALWTTALAVAFVAIMLLIVRPFLRRLGARVASPEGLTPPVIAVTLLGLIVSSATTELIGVDALFGAFLFGAVLPKEGRLAETLADRLETVAIVLLLPLFFAYSGLRTEIGLVSEPQAWLVTAVLIALATIGKLGGGAVAARLCGLRWRQATAIGVLLNTRGLMALIVLNLGMDAGVISPAAFTMLVIMALVTTFATTPALRWVYPDREQVRDRRVSPGELAPAAPAPFTVMMCVSDARSGPGLVTVAAALLGKRDMPARLFALHLWEPSDRLSVEKRRSGAPEHERALAPLVERASALTIDVRPLEFVSAEPAEDICRTAEAKQASLVLLGWHKPLLLEGRLGGTVGDVVARAAAPVGVLVDRGLVNLERVLVAFAGGPEDLGALELARRLAQSPQAELTLLHVTPPADAAHAGAGRAQINQVFQDPEAASGSIQVKMIEHESAPDAVLAEASRGYDLVIIGMNATWGLEAGALALRRERVLIESRVSILAVHAPAAAHVGQADPAPPSPLARAGAV